MALTKGAISAGNVVKKTPSVPKYSRGALVRRLNGEGNKRVRNKPINRGGPSIEQRAQRSTQAFKNNAQKNAVPKNYYGRNGVSFLTNKK